MNAIIVSSQAAPFVHEAIGHTDISFQKTGRFEDAEFMEFCESVSRINITNFILDTDTASTSIFLQGVRQYRSVRPATKIVIIALDRYEDDGTIHQLADMGIEVITTAPGTPAKSIVPALKNLLPDKNDPTVSLTDWDSGHSEMKRVKDSIYRYTSRIKGNQTLAGSDVLEFELPDVPMQEKIVTLDRIIGTVIVAVMGVESKAGSTHQSIVIANYLKKKGYSVGIVEANNSNDFTVIENAYQGTPDFKGNTTHFTIEGVTYYKTNKKHEMSEFVTAGHNYLILDIGSFAESEWRNEFYRASVQIVMGAGSEWRQNKIRRFRDIHKQTDQSNWMYCIPFVEKLTIQDIRKQMPGNQIHRLPVHPDPYRSLEQTDHVLYKILRSYMGDGKHGVSKKMLYSIIGVFGVVIVVLIVILFSGK